MLCVPTCNGKNLTDVDPEQAKAACANKAQSLKVEQGGGVLETLQPSQFLHTQNQGGPAPVKDTQQRLKTLLQRDDTALFNFFFFLSDLLHNLQRDTWTVLTTETVRANERLRIWTGSLVCCLPLDALPSFEGSLTLKYEKRIKLIYWTGTKK